MISVTKTYVIKKMQDKTEIMGAVADAFINKVSHNYGLDIKEFSAFLRHKLAYY